MLGNYLLQPNPYLQLLINVESRCVLQHVNLGARSGTRLLHWVNYHRSGRSRLRTCSIGIRPSWIANFKSHMGHFGLYFNAATKQALWNTCFLHWCNTSTRQSFSPKQILHIQSSGQYILPFNKIYSFCVYTQNHVSMLKNLIFENGGTSYGVV